MIPTAEARVQRATTTWFIKADITEIVLVPRTKTPNGSGGFTWTNQPPRQPAVGRVIPLTGQARERLNADGVTVPVEFLLIMDWDAVIAPFDQFTARGRTFQVVHIQEKRDYQTKAELITVG